jgi:hypothetical protein
MRRTGIISALFLLLVACPMLAQIPRTINFQGRARDANGVYLTGTRNVRLSIYQTAAGGSAIWSETQNVTFDNGQFTTVLGGGTTGGIPYDIDFNRPLWLGVQITGFNSGQELTPRLRFHSSPYSMRSGQSDTAGLAIQLEMPAVFNGSSSGALLSVIANAPIGIEVSGEEYAIVSDAPDSTSHWYVSGKEAGTGNQPVAGALYRDNTPVAWGTVNGSGGVITSFGIGGIKRTATGTYEISLSNPPAIIPSLEIPDLAIIVQPTSISGGSALVFGTWYFSTSDVGNVIVRIVDNQNRPTDSPFSVVMFGRLK